MGSEEKIFTSLEKILREYIETHLRRELKCEVCSDGKVQFIPNKWKSDEKVGYNLPDAIVEWVKGKEVFGKAKEREYFTFLTITGDWGVGKTANALITAKKLLEEGIPAIYVDAEEIIRAKGDTFIEIVANIIPYYLDPEKHPDIETEKENIEKFIKKIWDTGKPLVFIIDNLHKVSPKMIREIFLIS